MPVSIQRSDSQDHRRLRAAGATENLAAAGAWLAMGSGIYLAWRNRLGLAEVTAILLVAFASLLGKYDIWDSAYATGRTMSPLLVLLALVGLKEQRFFYTLPLLMFLPRIALQFQAQITSALR
jgi:hypothetical protein